MSAKTLDEKSALEAQIKELASQKLKRIDAFNFDWENPKLEKPKDLLRELKELATIQSIGSSTRIEGVQLDDTEVRELINNLDINKLKTRDEEEVVGYYETLDLVVNEFKSIGLSEAHIKQLHNVLLQHSTKDTRHKGEYKSLSNKVAANYPDGTQKVIFHTTEPYLVSKEMSELIEWTNTSLRDTNKHPLIVAATFTYEFLSIHPFQDGNGRLSRLLTSLLLMRAGYDFIQYISLEHVVEERKKDYYKVLMEGQKNRYSKKEDISLWLIFVLECLETAIERLKVKLGSAELSYEIRPVLNDRQEEILRFIKSNGSARMSDLVNLLSEYSRPTLSGDLRILLDHNLIVKHGTGRGTFYKALI